MPIKLFALLLAIGLAGTCLVNAQSPSTAASPAKHRAHKKAEVTASPTENAASPSTAESLAASPKKKRTGKKAKTETVVSLAASPAASASPSKFGGSFKPKS